MQNPVSFKHLGGWSCRWKRRRKEEEWEEWEEEGLLIG